MNRATKTFNMCGQGKSGLKRLLNNFIVGVWVKLYYYCVEGDSGVDVSEVTMSSIHKIVTLLIATRRWFVVVVMSAERIKCYLKGPLRPIIC